MENRQRIDEERKIRLDTMPPLLPKTKCLFDHQPDYYQEEIFHPPEAKSLNLHAGLFRGL